MCRCKYGVRSFALTSSTITGVVREFLGEKEETSRPTLQIPEYGDEKGSPFSITVCT